MITIGGMPLAGIFGLLIVVMALMAIFFNVSWGTKRKRFIIAWIFAAIMGLLIFGLAWHEKDHVSLPKNAQKISF